MMRTASRSVVVAAVLAVAVVAFPAVAAADAAVVRIDAGRSSGCDFQVALEVFGGSETLVVAGDAPSGITAVGDTNPAGGDFAGGVELDEGFYLVDWDGADNGGDELTFEISIAGQAISVPVEVPVCDDIASIAAEGDFEEYLESAPEVPAAEPASNGPIEQAADDDDGDGEAVVEVIDDGCGGCEGVPG